MNEPEKTPETNPERILPTAEKIGEQFGVSAQKQWEKANDGRKRAMYLHWLQNPPEKRVEDSIARDIQNAGGYEAVRELLELGRTYVITGDGEIMMRVRTIGYKAKLKTATDPHIIAQRALHCHILDTFLNGDYVDFSEIIHIVRDDPRCTPLTDNMIKAAYLHFIETLIKAREIKEETFENDETL